jgi:hypothetical protein
VHRFATISLVCGAVLGLTGCSTDSAPQLDDLRERFVAAGGECSDWTSLNEPLALGAKTCTEGATLVVFESTEDRADFIKSELETNEQIRARTHIIVSKDKWLVIDSLAVIVRVIPAMGGMISGRNGANP